MIPRSTDKQPDQRARRDQLEARHGPDFVGLIPPPLEPADLCGEYLTLLFEAGPVQSGGMGATALSWSEIDAWLRRSGEQLSPPEVRLIRALSGVYAAALRDMTEPGAVPVHLKDDEDYLAAKDEAMIDYLRAVGDGA